MRTMAAQWKIRRAGGPGAATLKAAYPAHAMERYVGWTDAEGLPPRPGMRPHTRAWTPAVVRVIPRAMVIAGTVKQWEAWTDMRFPDTDSYVVPGALQPVVSTRARRRTLRRPQLWMVHRL